MSKEESYLEYLTKKINNADGTIEAIEVLPLAQDKLREAQNARIKKEIQDANESEKNEAVENQEKLVKDIKERMKKSMAESSNIDFAEKLEAALKERFAKGNGQKITHAVIDNDGYEIYEDSDDTLDR